MQVLKIKVISLPYIFQILYVLCFTGPRLQVSVYRTIGPLVLKLILALSIVFEKLVLVLATAFEKLIFAVSASFLTTKTCVFCFCLNSYYLHCLAFLKN